MDQSAAGQHFRPGRISGCVVAAKAIGLLTWTAPNDLRNLVRRSLRQWDSLTQH